MDTLPSLLLSYPYHLLRSLLIRLRNFVLMPFVYTFLWPSYLREGWGWEGGFSTSEKPEHV